MNKKTFEAMKSCTLRCDECATCVPFGTGQSCLDRLEASLRSLMFSLGMLSAREAQDNKVDVLKNRDIHELYEELITLCRERYMAEENPAMKWELSLILKEWEE